MYMQDLKEKNNVYIFANQKTYNYIKFILNIVQLIKLYMNIYVHLNRYLASPILVLAFVCLNKNFNT